MSTLNMKQSLHAGVKRAARDFDRLRPPDIGVSVLEYHRVGANTSAELNVDVDVFDRHMGHVSTRCDATTLDDAIVDLRTVPPLAENRVTVTFDDGTMDLFEHAFPILSKYSIPALIYVATDFVDRQVPFPLDGTPLTWHALREMSASGLISVGSHTHTHAVVDKLDASQLRSELQRSKTRIEDELQQPVKHFAYPKGVRARGDLEQVVIDEFETAAIAGSRLNTFMQTDLHRLDRIPIQRSDGWASFLAKLDGGMRLEGQLRGLLNRARYARKSN